jgi:hypothetical protein
VNRTASGNPVSDAKTLFAPWPLRFVGNDPITNRV